MKSAPTPPKASQEPCRGPLSLHNAFGFSLSLFIPRVDIRPPAPMYASAPDQTPFEKPRPLCSISSILEVRPTLGAWNKTVRTALRCSTHDCLSLAVLLNSSPVPMLPDLSTLPVLWSASPRQMRQLCSQADTFPSVGSAPSE